VALLPFGCRQLEEWSDLGTQEASELSGTGLIGIQYWKTIREVIKALLE
jgi:hypothetical protein